MDQYSKELVIGDWGEFILRNDSEGETIYKVTKKISLDVVLPPSEKRILVDFGIAPVQNWGADVILSTNAVQTFDVPAFELGMQTRDEIRPGRRDKNCPICFDDMDILAPTTTHLQCKRTFHKDCLAQWIATSRTKDSKLFINFAICPNCRHTILPPSPDSTLKAALVSCFPPGSNLHSVSEYRPPREEKFSSGTTSMLVTVELSNGTFKQYFMKYATGPGVDTTKGEFQAMKAIHDTKPELDLVAKPIISKTFTDIDLEKHFFLCDFIGMTNNGSRAMPSKETWRRLIKLHQLSVSPTGQFGFHIQTYIGGIPQHVEWDTCWASFSKKLLSSMMELETEIRGPWKDDNRFQRTLQEVVPRLIGALERDGRKVKPSLIHGNIFGSWGRLYESGNSVFYRASSYFAHHEMEWAFLALTGSSRLEREDIDAVLHVLDEEEGWSEPQCERHDRLRLYQIYFGLVRSIDNDFMSPVEREL